MEDIKMIPLSDVIDITKKFVLGEISDEEFSQFGDKLTIRSYMPILEKMSVITALMTNNIYNQAELLEVRFAELLKNVFFYGLMQGYCFIDCNDTSLLTYANYDLLYPIFSKFILSFCGEDWELFKEYLKQIISAYQTADLGEILSQVDEGEMFKATKANEELIKKLEDNKKMVEDLSHISDIINPSNKKVIESLRNIAIKTINGDENMTYDEKCEALEKIVKENK